MRREDGITEVPSAQLGLLWLDRWEWWLWATKVYQAATQQRTGGESGKEEKEEEGGR